MLDFLFYFLVLVLLVGGGVACAVMFRGYLDGDTSGSGLFGGRSERRLEVLEHSSVDSRRKLILIRRDRIEHLIMTGGPVDVVIETNIDPFKSSKLESVANLAEARAPRTFARVAVGE